MRHPGAGECRVQLLPSGKFDLNDRRGSWVVDEIASVIVASTADLKRGMPVDMDRDKEAEAPTAGWIEKLGARRSALSLAWMSKAIRMTVRSLAG